MSEARSFFDILSLCLRSRCPVCAEGHLFVPILNVRRFGDLPMPPENCGSCGFKFGREPGYYFGVLTPVLPMLSLGSGAFFAGSEHVFLSPEIPNVLIAGALGTALGMVLFFRTSIAIYIAIDHAIDPPSPQKGLRSRT